MRNQDDDSVSVTGAISHDCEHAVDRAYLLDDVMILAIGVVTLSHRRLQAHEGRWLKLVGGMVMVGLGVILIAKPEWLAR